MEKQTQFNLWYVIIAVIGVLFLRDMWVSTSQVQPIPYSEFQHHLKTGQLESITISNNVIQGKLNKPLADGRTRIVTTRVDPVLAKDLGQFDVRFEGVVENTFFRDMLSWIIPALVFFALWGFLARRFAEQGGMGGGFLSVGKSKAKVYMETDTKVTFEDVAGVDEAKEELKEIIGFPCLSF